MTSREHYCESSLFIYLEPKNTSNSSTMIILDCDMTMTLHAWLNAPKDFIFLWVTRAFILHLLKQCQGSMEISGMNR